MKNRLIRNKFEKIEKMLALLMDAHRARYFGERADYELWQLSDTFQTKT